MAKKIVETPLMKQYAEMKQKHPDAILLFRVGDFYETFSDDAIAASEILGITLTRRANGAAQYVELAGFPHHALDTYLPKLVRAGKRVAICEQLEDPKLTKKLVKRGITELVTPGVAMGDNVLDHRSNNFLAALWRGKRDTGVAFLDISTGEFLAAQGADDYIDKLMANFAPKELLVETGYRGEARQRFNAKLAVFGLDDWAFTFDGANERLLRQFGTQSLKGFGLHDMPEATVAAGAILHYLDITQHTQTSHITSIGRIEQDRYVRLDGFTMRNLELVQPMAEEGATLLSVIDHTVTPMGARMLSRWILFPLKSVKEINRRLDIVDYMFRSPDAADVIRERLQTIGDLERLVGKVSTQRITPREMLQLATSLESIAPIREVCIQSGQPDLKRLGQHIDPLPDLSERIRTWIRPDAPNAVNRGDVIAHGVDSELDELRAIAFEGKDYLARLQQREMAATGISSLKIGYNNVFGYYIEVTNTHRDKVPQEWIRKQTLVNAERYITPELKTYEEKIMGAQERIEAIEAQLYARLVAHASRFIAAMQTNASTLARLDCLHSFAYAARLNKYVRPVVDDSMTLQLVGARHPVIEQHLPAGQKYISNDLTLDPEQMQIMMLTGPNMSGKSALLRQTALNVIMAQIGSYIAADSGHIGIVDKIFTRVGASDNISLGESTFMVEMTEAAAILNNISARSLILFDELGRGTSTYDGISIAWAIVEALHEGRGAHPKTLFATHYHELNDMAQQYARVHNYHIATRQVDGRIVFLRKLREGGSEHSFGIHVARLAGIPTKIVDRADAVLRLLEKSSVTHNGGINTEAIARGDLSSTQMSFFALDDPVLEQVRDRLLTLDINGLTPLQALNTLSEIRSIVTGK